MNALLLNDLQRQRAASADTIVRIQQWHDRAKSQNDRKVYAGMLRLEKEALKGIDAQIAKATA